MMVARGDACAHFTDRKLIAAEKPLPAYLATPALPSQGGLDGCQSRGRIVHRLMGDCAASENAILLALPALPCRKMISAADQHTTNSRLTRSPRRHGRAGSPALRDRAPSRF